MSRTSEFLVLKPSKCTIFFAARTIYNKMIFFYLELNILRPINSFLCKKHDDDHFYLFLKYCMGAGYLHLVAFDVPGSPLAASAAFACRHVVEL